jgi:TolA-binding protein
MLCGALGGAILAPQPAGAVSKEMIQLQQQVAQLLQAQQDLRTAVDSNSAMLKTLVQQSLDSVSQLHSQMGALQKTVQEVQANTGSRIDTMTQQTQGLSDNLQDVQARVGKLSQQVTDMQNLLQSIDAKVSGGAPAGAAAGMTPGTTPGMAPAAMPPISADTLYQNALRDLTGGKYDLSRQEFSDYIRNFPANDLASNAQFYLGEIAYAQNDFKGAIAAYDTVLTNYPKLQARGFAAEEGHGRGRARTEGQRHARSSRSRPAFSRFGGSPSRSGQTARSRGRDHISHAREALRNRRRMSESSL